MLRLSRAKFTILGLTVLFLLYSFVIEYILSDKYDLVSVIRLSMIFLIIPCFVFLFISVYKFEHKIGFVIVFLGLGFAFYYGQFLLIMFGYYDELSRLYISLVCGRIKAVYVIYALYTFIRGMLFFYVGYIFVAKDTPPNMRYSYKDINNKIYIPNTYHIVASAIFLVSSICSFLQIGFELRLGSYTNAKLLGAELFRFSSGSPMFYAAYFAKWFLPSTYMLLLFHAIRGNQRKYNFYLIILGIYIILYLGTGARFQVLKAISALYIIHNYFVRPFSKKDLKWIIPFGIIGVVGLSVISGIRSTSVSVSGALSYVSLLSPERIFFNIFNETGITSISLANTMQYCPSEKPHIYFLCIVKSLSTILPSIANPFLELASNTTSRIFSPLLYGFGGVGYGSSFITEAYYYWGNFLYIVILLYGVAVGKINNSFKNNIFSYKSINHIFLIVYILSEMIYCIRNDVFDLPRGMVYYVAIPLIFINLTSRTSLRKIRTIHNPM